MKKAIILLCISLFSYSFGQENKEYLKIDFTSICCGTPSQQPLIDYIKDFQKQEKLKKFEIWRESELGYEGEFALYIGLDQLKKTKKIQFLNEVKNISESFNMQRNKNKDGYINVSEKLVLRDFINQKKKIPRNQFSKMMILKY